MERVLKVVLMAVAALAAAVAPVMAQQQGTQPAAAAGKPDSAGIVADLSTHTVAIRTDFAGTRVLLFGALVRTEEEGKARPGIVVVVRGPEKSFRLHRKQRIAGVWVNTNERTFSNVPAYYAVLSNMPLEDIAAPAALKVSGIGFAVLRERLMAAGSGFVDEREAAEYAEAFIRLQRRRRLYQIDEAGVKMTGRYLFRAQFDLPANVPLGTYHAQVFLFRGGRLLGQYESPLIIEKRGFEQFVYDLAHRRPLVYGVAAVIIAVAAGFAAAAAFRKG